MGRGTRQTQEEQEEIWIANAELARSPGHVLLLMDDGIFVPRGTLSRSLASGSPQALMQQVASILAGSIYIREIPVKHDL